MFTRIKRSRNTDYLQVVESYRDGERIRQRCKLYIGPYKSLDDAISGMAARARYFHRKATGCTDTVTGREMAAEYRDKAEARDDKAEALREFVRWFPDVHAQDRERALRRIRRDRAPEAGPVHSYPYAWVWGNSKSAPLLNPRKGQRCRVLIRSRYYNSALIEFEDGYRVNTSRNGIRLAEG